MNLTVYLPDDLAQKAKDRNVVLSRTLRDALIEQFEQEDAMAGLASGTEIHELRLEDRDGRSYTGRLDAREIASSGDWTVFVTAKENIVAYNAFRAEKTTIGDPEIELRSILAEAEYLDAMAILGIEATVDLDL